MKISYQWLKQYVDLDLSPEKLEALLTGCGLEVEGVEEWESVKGGLEGVVIGEVVECIPHPDSDHLHLTRVDVGKQELLSIVCGAPNVAAKQKVPVATVGTTLYFGDKELQLKKTRIRGAVSEGMICAEDELGLGTSHDGIMVLDETAIPGTPASEYFDITRDTVFQIGLTPNRSDATSHVGVARDLVAVLNHFDGGPVENIRASLKLPDVSGFRIDNHDRPVTITVEDQEACPRYTGVTINNVKVGPSPAWLQNYLMAVGLRPLNNVVDITNFVLMELGQPLHAFDADKIAGDKVVVKTYPEGTPFITLDEAERKLQENDLMICSESEPMCIAGVFGGIGSGVTEKTKTVFLESACFDPVWIRKTARRHGLQTDASFRFERGTDIEITEFAIKRAALLIKEIAGGEISSDIVDVYPKPLKKKEVVIKFDHVDRLIGQAIPAQVVEGILLDLGFTILQEDQEGMTVVVPAFKVEVTREADVIEEILRVYGYNNIRIPASVKSILPFVQFPDPDHVKGILAALLTAKGFYEIKTNSLTTSGYYKENPVFPGNECVVMSNPNSRDLDVMRQTLVYGGLESIRYNQNRKAFDLRFFETGAVYRKKLPASGEKSVPDTLKSYQEQDRLSLWITGRVSPENWHTSQDMTDIFALKAYVLDILMRLDIDLKHMKFDTHVNELFSEGFQYLRDGRTLVEGGVLKSRLLQEFDIKTPVYYADFDFDFLMKSIPDIPRMVSELPRFPVVRRDLALLIDSAVTFEEIRKIAWQSEKKLLLDMTLFDVYEGEKIAPGKKSYALGFLLGDPQKTLTDKEIDKTMNRLIRAFHQEFGAEIR